MYDIFGGGWFFIFHYLLFLGSFRFKKLSSLSFSVSAVNFVVLSQPKLECVDQFSKIFQYKICEYPFIGSRCEANIRADGQTDVTELIGAVCDFYKVQLFLCLSITPHRK